jgi:hypothetical protein
MRALRTVFALMLVLAGVPAARTQPPAPAPHAGAWHHFRAAIYVTVADTRRLADRAAFEREFARVSSQLRFDKVYIEAYRDHVFATDDELERVKSYFQAHGIETAGGITLAAGGQGGQFGTFDYESPADRAECERAVRTIARHFDEVILDDFFFYTSKSDADIAARGNRSWTQYRLETMRAVARDLVLAPARATNPHVRVIIKYPNWYEHFQGLGYDLDREAHAFDAIYTGTETRDPEITDQLLQQYESYEIFRYFSNIRPDGGNRGGWVDTFGTRAVDRYGEQLWDTLFARAPQIMLFSWSAMADPGPARAGERGGWAAQRTSLDWDRIARDWQSAHPGAAAGWASAANGALDAADAVLGALGRPTGIASYKPYQSSGEDFLHDYLGNIGIPIELTPAFPDHADTILLTEAATADPRIIERIEARLRAGARVIVTSGFLAATRDRFQQLAEWRPTGGRAAIDTYYNGFGAGNGTPLNPPGGAARAVLFPEIRFYTNDSWPIIRGAASSRGLPIMLMNRYSRGTLLLLTIPENIGDLYNLPQPLLTQIRAYLAPDAPVRLDAPDHVALFTYDNGAFVVENYRDTPAEVGLSLAGAPSGLVEVPEGAMLRPSLEAPASDPRRGPPEPARRTFRITVPPHSFRVFRPAG